MPSEQTRKRLLEHCQSYPNLQIEDLFKFIFQSAFGCEHMVSSKETAVDWIRREYDAGIGNPCMETEPLDGAYSRVHLSWLAQGLSAETLGALFCDSARCEPNGERMLHDKLCVARELAEKGKLPFSAEALEEKRKLWEREGYGALHHSTEFRRAYRPTYRVISNEYAQYLPLFARIDHAMQQGRVVLAIEGSSAAGKTTLAQLLQRVYGCAVFHMDDFFLQPHQRTAERLSEIGGNLDRERFLEEVLKPLKAGKTVNFHRFDCTTQTMELPTEVLPHPLTVVEGVYSMHPELAPYYDFSVYLDIDSAYQRTRILKRNSPQYATFFFERWIPMENLYFSKTSAKERCDLSFLIAEEN